MDPEESVVISGYPDQKIVAFSKDNGRTYEQFRLPLDTRDYRMSGTLLYYINDIYKYHRAHFKSYYHNFYEVLFPK